jgi:hypothetical protein
MHRTLALLSLFVAFTWGGAAAQVTDDTLVPRGQLRLLFTPSFSAWDSRFGNEAEEQLADDLTDATGAAVFPGLADLEARVRALTGDGSFTGLVGSSSAVVGHDVTRIDLGGHVGVFDWLTVGVVVPLLKNRTVLDVAFRPDTLGGNLGLNPTITNGEAVAGFLTGLENAVAAADARAQAVCTGSPGTSSCTDAVTLTGRVSSFFESSRSAYQASALFPIAGSPAADALTTSAAALDQDLSTAGLAGIGADMAFASEWVTDETFTRLSSTGGSGIQGTALGSIDGIWALGDVELSALVRVAEGEVRDSGAAVPRYAYSLGAGVVTRLGTGSVDEQDVFLDLGSGDGQIDVEGRVFGSLSVGSRLGLRIGVRYGVQRPLSLLRRVAPPEQVTPPIGSLRAVRWSPAAYMGVEIEPQWALAEGLSVFGTYRMYSKGTDGYEVLGDTPAGGIPVDITDLERESGVGLHQAGLGVRYSTVARWLRGAAGSPMELHMRVLFPVSGSGGQTPVATSVEMGIRLYRGLWGR